MPPVRLTFISDTHSRHQGLNPGSGDVLVHCGDLCRRGDLEEVDAFADFMAEQDFTHKIVIAGNHDWCFEDKRRHEAEAVLDDHGIHYLNDSGLKLCGVNFWGSPIQPTFMNWAFNRQRGEQIRRHWELIPDDTDVLITHGPVYGILDRCFDGRLVGCEELLETVKRVKPRIYACGHIHEDYGSLELDGTLFINASSLDERYRLKHEPIAVDYCLERGHATVRADSPDSAA